MGRVAATTWLELVAAQLQVAGFALKEDVRLGRAPASFNGAAQFITIYGIYLVTHVHGVLGGGGPRVPSDLSAALQPPDTATAREGRGGAAAGQQRRGGGSSRGRARRSRGRGTRKAAPVELAHNAGWAVARALGAGRLTEVYAAAAHAAACSLLDLCCATMGPLAKDSQLQQGGDGARCVCGLVI